MSAFCDQGLCLIHWSNIGITYFPSWEKENDLSRNNNTYDSVTIKMYVTIK